MSQAATELDTRSPFGTYPAERMVRAAWRLADRHDLSRGLRKRIRAFVAYIFKGPYDLEAEGLKFRIYPGENYDDRKMLAKGRLPERAEHELLEPHLGEGTVFVDVGANIGSYSVFAARRGASVLAIEANPQTAHKLSFNVTANDLDNVTVVHSAVGAQEDTLPLWLEPSNCGFATFVKDLTTGEWAGNWEPTYVKVRPLTAIADQHGVAAIDILKVDVEGFEDRVVLPFLRHADRQQWPRVILLETNCRPYWSEDCLPELASRGYEVTGRTDDNMIFELKG
ncbi:FkbM family methyltransferase [Roseibium album]|uniref:Methyltransferase, FkbM family n=1 Tax=Roseibium album TaxID=311410 RepID=A0A0M6ZZN5_9HYPH|nr:FkbM family methyltransferase [Roseibium album]CTQ61252.1 methyltransferase, FkbM family [Roseibium album]CTQ67797.1 methyltransferase, FkbM family [Roseibium album]CTQ79018.1 methyltransferase, FkbM family [Roseibium album]